MLCDNCKLNQANYGLRLQVNGHVQELHLCSDCYSKIGSQLKSPTGASPFGGYANGFPFEDLMKGYGMSGTGQATTPETKPGVGGGGFLDEFGRNISGLAAEGKIDPVVGRAKEVARVIEILNRRNKNNPVLIGEPGVGKTAIAEGLALKIAAGQVPSKLQHKQIYSLDVASLVADTGIRGQFEERMKTLIAELNKRTEVILFIDEIHLLVGAGSAQGSMDAGNILKPALARGDLQVIGATTLKEYRVIEKDAALERRFQPVMVNEPSVDEAVTILHGIQSQYESFHKVAYTDEAIRACVTLSSRYIQDRYLPDKAIDLMDEAGSKVNLREGSHDTADLQARLRQVIRQKEQATKTENYELAAKLRDEETRLQAEIQTTDRVSGKVEVTPADIQQIIEEKTGIPVQKLQEAEQAKLKDLENRLANKVIGQQEAVQKVAKAIRRSRAGLKSSRRPIGSFLFVGPTGVGKTELAKCLAEELFGTKDAMVRLDMSEYMEKHSVSKLIGSPPGYVGYDEAGQLTEQVRRNPYSLILLDEIEKAHPDVQHMFLQIMEDGRLTDSQGRTVSFKDTVLIMTSNAGVTERKVTVGFGVDAVASQAQNHLASLGAFFKPEFLNRFDAVIEFNALAEADMVRIVDTMVKELRDGLSERDVTLTLTDAAKQKLAEMGYSATFGARPLRRVLQDQVEDRISDLLLDNPELQQLTVDVEDAQVVVRVD
ncbi:ATP-dependent Clp protease ATP-binding subunit [Alicyclobacillus sp. ALC3]|uniref:ATP-dependent Clp protease ATP-binding subunit n=1 Tax=Alicyclobacillus sp. ALC3 TaxID=2796143 RepID=UPI00237990E9|nr:ATP-dependent Clp protease ATP-binding subunit [Alicyclobacillus sp. ALC3]WDL95778.1 ATP-dependent Clp protease ATP-binding subunit [Alicyclobacillus sp. ALC3]